MRECNLAIEHNEESKEPWRDMTAEHTADSDCPFCGIVAGEVPASVVYQDDVVFAFLDIHPLVPGHVLVIPRAHVASLGQLDANASSRLLPVAIRIAEALKRSPVRCEAVNLFLSDGEVAGQEVFHLHLHVIPRYEGDAYGHGRPLKPIRPALPGRSELDEIAERLRAALAHTDDAV